MSNLFKANKQLVLGVSTALSLFSSAAAAATATTTLTPEALCDPASVSIYKFDKTDDSKPKDKLEIGVLTCKPKADLDKEFVGTAVFYPAVMTKSKEKTLKEQSGVIEQTIKHGAFDSPNTRLMFLPNDMATYQCKIIDISEPYKMAKQASGDEPSPPLDLSNFKMAHTNCDGLIKHGGQLYADEIREAKRHEATVKLLIETAFASYQKMMNFPAFNQTVSPSFFTRYAWPYKLDLNPSSGFSARFGFPMTPADKEQPKVDSAPKEPVNAAQPLAQPPAQPSAQPAGQPAQPSPTERVFFSPTPISRLVVALQSPR